jgi:xylulokinase
MTQIVPDLTIGASYGDAFLAGLTSGILVPNDLSSWVNYKTEISPDFHSHQIYETLYGDYLELYLNNREILHHLSRISSRLEPF